MNNSTDKVYFFLYKVMSNFNGVVFTNRILKQFVEAEL